MALGKRIAIFIGAICLCVGSARGGEIWEGAGEAALSPSGVAVQIGGEMRIDYAYRHTRADGPVGHMIGNYGDLATRNVNLRLAVTAAPKVHAYFKFNLAGGNDFIDDEILDEALLVMSAVGGSDLELFAGQGRAPYGQDITLGMIQSYNHTANRAYTPEGDVYIIDPPGTGRFPAAGLLPCRSLPPMRPGQFDRALLAGAAYGRDDVWRAELALFQPADNEYRERLRDRRSGSDIGLAARLWWRPIEDLVLEASGILAHSGDMASAWLRADLPPGIATTACAESVSVGFDWKPADWRVFGEYQHGWDWDFTEGYATDSVQLGVVRLFGDRWRVGGMGEAMRIAAGSGMDYLDRYYKAVLNLRHDFTPGIFAMAELGAEWYSRSHPVFGREKRRGLFVGFRLGLTF